MAISLYTAEDCEAIAASAALRYVSDKKPGIHRRKHGKGFSYYDSQGKRITEQSLLKRIKALAIPPAYQSVWICPTSNGHIQATGLDDKNRKQYIYHPLWHKARQEKKFNTLIEFGQCLPKIRRHVARELKKPLNLSKKQMLCAIIYLLDTACVRIGNSKYAKENHSYGLTTLRKKHLSIHGKKALLDFPGKNAQSWHIILENRRLIKLLKKCEEIPGYELFKYYNEDGSLSIISSQDVNGYLQHLTGYPFTAKTFRTWAACRETFYRLIKNKPSTAALKGTIQEVAALLGHTPSVCQKSYINPDIILQWKEGLLEDYLKKQTISCRNRDKILLFWLEHQERSDNHLA